MDLGLWLDTTDSREFVVRPEQHGVPQARRRVIEVWERQIREAPRLDRRLKPCDQSLRKRVNSE